MSIVAGLDEGIFCIQNAVWYGSVSCRAMRFERKKKIRPYSPMLATLFFNFNEITFGAFSPSDHEPGVVDAFPLAPVLENVLLSFNDTVVKLASEHVNHLRYGNAETLDLRCLCHADTYMLKCCRNNSPNRACPCCALVPRHCRFGRMVQTTSLIAGKSVLPRRYVSVIFVDESFRSMEPDLAMMRCFRIA